jgi:mannan endo-1,4-beta-mannosidase
MKRLLYPVISCFIIFFSCAFTKMVQAQLKVNCRFLQDANGNNIVLKGVNVPVYHSGYVDDLDGVSAAVQKVKANAVRIHWSAKPAPTVPFYYDAATATKTSIANLDRAITRYTNLGMLCIVNLFDLTLYSIPDPQNPNEPWKRFSTLGNDKNLFASVITSYWTNAEVVALVNKHKNHLIINIANEWGSTRDDNYQAQPSLTTNFIQNYTAAIQAIRNAGITVPLMVDAPDGGANSDFLVANGAVLINADRLQNTMLSVHTYWSNYNGGYSDADIDAKLTAMANSKLPFIIGEASNKQDGNSICQYDINYDKILKKATQLKIGHIIWAWYQDGCVRNVYDQDNGTVPNTQPQAQPFATDVLSNTEYGITNGNTRPVAFTPATGKSYNDFYKNLISRCGWKTNNCKTCFYSLKASIAYTDLSGYTWKATVPLWFSEENYWPLPVFAANGDVLDISKIGSLTASTPGNPNRDSPFRMSREVALQSAPALTFLNINEFLIDITKPKIVIGYGNRTSNVLVFDKLSFFSGRNIVTGTIATGSFANSRASISIKFDVEENNCN